MTEPAPNPITPHEHALAYGALGLRALPIRPGGKAPPFNSWQHAATDDPAKINNWYKGLYRDCGVGIALGDQPNGWHLFALDCDNHGNGTATGEDELHDLEQQHGPLPDTWRAITGSGGVHLIFRAPEGVTVRNQQATGNRVAPHIDVRGEGGQIVVAPTIHPTTLNAYAWEHGYEPWALTPATAPDWLIELVREPDPLPTPSPAPTQVDRDDTVFQRQRAEWNWHVELVALGWQQDQRHPDRWVRPGKDPRHGHSAILHGDEGPFVVFTTEIPHEWRAAGKPTRDSSGWSFGPFGFYAATRHGGDRSAAARALADRYGVTYDLADLIGDSGGDEPEPVDDDDWARRPLAELARAIQSGEHEPEVPVHLHVEGGMPLFYRGRLHSIFGPPGGGKTWVALASLVERLKAGEHVLMIDWEDAEQGTVSRLLQLGCTLDDIDRFDYRNPSTSLAYGFSKLEETPTAWSIVVMDSAGEALAAQGVELNDDTGTAQWMQLAKRLARRESQPSVVMLDHVPKAGDEPAKYAIGSQRKLAAITGASYRCDTIVEPAKGKAGKLKLVVAKDRLGNRPKGATACEVDMIDDDDLIALTFHISEAQAAAERGEKFRPTYLMERISRWLELHPGSSKRKITEEVTGKKAAIDQAIEVLIEEGFVKVEREGQTHVHTVVVSFREDVDSVSGLVDNSNRVPASHRVPTASRESGDSAETDRVPRVPGGLYPGTRDAVRGSEITEGESPVDNSPPPTLEELGL